MENIVAAYSFNVEDVTANVDVFRVSIDFNGKVILLTETAINKYSLINN